MKLVVAVMALASVSAFGQTNAAEESMQKRLGSLDLLNPSKLQRAPARAPVAVASAAPHVCAIPLLSALPAGTAVRDRMGVVLPPTISSDPQVHVPAPVCAQGLFQNK